MVPMTGSFTSIVGVTYLNVDPPTYGPSALHGTMVSDCPSILNPPCFCRMLAQNANAQAQSPSSHLSTQPSHSATPASPDHPTSPAQIY